MKSLSFLTADQARLICEKYESVEALYAIAFQLEAKEYHARTQKPADIASVKNIRKALFDLEDALDAIGVDGHRIITAISSDHGDLIVGKIV